MQSLPQLAQELKLTDDQLKGIENYISQLVAELLESLKQDNLKNFDETIDQFKS